NEETYTHWLTWYREYHKRFDDATVDNDYQLYQVLRAAYQQDITSVKKEVTILLAIADSEQDRLHTFKNLIKVCKV
ncbi:GGDEF domain-containing protein, partial [Erysipelatoclostridium ramosum]|nr:GGDEF domain-containing protein [Thomasclavelia ramosa]